MSDDEFMARLEDCTLPPDQFHHGEHVHAAWLYLRRYPAAEAIAKYSQALRQYAGSLGKADRYHETITWAYLLLLNERIARSPLNATWEQFAAEHRDLFDWRDSILLKYYHKETLESEVARRIFVMPDRLGAALGT